jgi:hypothetical protein
MADCYIISNGLQENWEDIQTRMTWYKMIIYLVRAKYQTKS